MRMLARPLVFLFWAFAGAVGTLLLTVAASLLIGQHAVVVLSGSMQPAIDTGDVLIEEEIPPTQARVGDIITYKQPGSDRMITHRVRGIHVRGSRVEIETKGDANNTTERFSISASGRVGKPLRRIPELGYITRFARTLPGLIACILVPLFTLAALELLDIWWPLPRPPRHAPPGRARGLRA